MYIIMEKQKSWRFSKIIQLQSSRYRWYYVCPPNRNIKVSGVELDLGINFYTVMHTLVYTYTFIHYKCVQAYDVNLWTSIPTPRDEITHFQVHCTIIQNVSLVLHLSKNIKHLQKFPMLPKNSKSSKFLAQYFWRLSTF